MAFGWEGALVRLVPLDKDKHLANAMRWLNDPDVTDGPWSAICRSHAWAKTPTSTA